MMNICKRRTCLIVTVLFGANHLIAQLSSLNGNVKWVNDVINEKVFVKNFGQFNRYLPAQSKEVLYGFEKNGFRALFHLDGITYNIETSLDDTSAMPETTTDLVSITWLGCNKNVEIVPGARSNEYFNYNYSSVTDNINNAPGFGSLTYKNIYNGIDLEYSFYPDKKGFKYSFIVHPGADPSQIIMKYSGAQLTMSNAGHLIISTANNSITDHAPQTFYEQEKGSINSQFVVETNTVRFSLENYQSNKTIVIDPWVTNPNLTAVNKAWSIERDAAGDLYVFGGQNPKVLRKYKSNGNPLWTTAIIPGFTNTHTSHATDNSGNSFLSHPISNYPKIYKVSPTGSVIVANNSANANIPPIPPLFGVYKLCFNKSKTELIAGSTTAGCLLAKVDQNTCDLQTMTSYTSFATEVRDICSSDNGSFYCLSVHGSGTFWSRVFRITSSSIPTSTLNLGWVNSSGYNNSQLSYGPNQSIGLGGIGPRNAIAASKCFVYTFNSEILYKRNAMLGIYITSVTIPGGAIKNNAGILVDSCDNVYVGTMQGISKYNSPNSTFNFIGSVPTPSAVLDMEFGNNYEIYACGPGMVASVAGIYNQCQAPLVVSHTSKPATCGQNNGWISVNSVTGGTPTYTYVWSNGASTPSINNLAPGTYTLKIIDSSCSLKSYYKVFNILAAPQPTINILSMSNIICHGSKASITTTVSGGTAPFTYSWLPGNQTSANISNLVAGSYTVKVADMYSCTSISTISITEPAAYSISVSTNSLACFGNTNGQASISVSGGDAPYNYQWSNGSTHNSISNVGAGMYSCIVTDQRGCATTQTVQITQPASLTILVNTYPQQACVGSTIHIQAQAQGGTGPFSFTCNGNSCNGTFTALEQLSGAYPYTFTCVDANLCSTTLSTSVFFNEIPLISTSNKTVCSGTNLELTANGTNNFKWLPMDELGSSILVTPSVSTNYTVFGIDPQTGCLSLPKIINVDVRPLPILNIATDKQSGCEPLCLSLNAQTSSNVLVLKWGFDKDNHYLNHHEVNNCFSESGTHTLTGMVINDEGCSNTSAITITVFPKPQANARIVSDVDADNPTVEFDNISSSNSVSWLWDLGDGKTSDLFEPIHTYADETATYKVFLVASTDHFCTDTTMLELTVKAATNLFVPNSFTPNSDGVNDTFFAKGTGINDFNLKIYDRWGHQLFESNDINDAWDGTYKGEEVKDGSYTWMINYSNDRSKNVVRTGSVVLMK